MNRTHVSKLTECSQCLTPMKHKYLRYDHKCSIHLCDPGDKPDRVVRDDMDVRELVEFQSVYRALKSTSTTGLAVPGVAPLFFPTSRSPPPPILPYLGCVDQNYGLLKMAASEGPVRIWKSLKIKHGDSVLQLTQNLVPSSKSQLKRRGLRMIDKQDHVIVYLVSMIPTRLITMRSKPDYVEADLL